MEEWLMFCTNCGKQLQDNVIFCPNCGSKTGANNNGQAADIVQNAAVSQAPQTVMEKPLPGFYNKPKHIKVLRVLSIIAVIWFPLCFVSYSAASMVEQVISYTFFAFGYAIAHSIVAIVQSSKHGIKPLKIMGIIGIVWYALSSICIIAFAEEDFDAYIGWVFLGLGYAVALAIVSLIKSKISS
jgi:hypothetical protein